MNLSLKQKIVIALVVAVFLLFCYEVYIPKSLGPSSVVEYTVARGSGYQEIGRDLMKRGVIKNANFFSIYALITGRFSKLQAGNYKVSSSMSVADITKKMAMGDVAKNTLTIIEGWDLQDIGQLFGGQKLDESLEGYLFPDTYELSQNGGLDELIERAKANFDKKLTPDLRQEIAAQKKTIFQIVTMASLLEKEVRSSEDKKIVAGILWKRVKIGMPLQIDATINYITGKTGNQITSKDKNIDSPYNTYKYYGLPQGPICNPGMDSILAAMYPVKSDYWYYLSADGTGTTVFSKTLEEHNAARAKYLK